MFKALKDTYSFTQLTKKINENLESAPITLENVNSVVEYIGDEAKKIGASYTMEKAYLDSAYGRIWEMLNPNGVSGNDMQKEWGLTQDNYLKLLKAKTAATKKELGL